MDADCSASIANRHSLGDVLSEIIGRRDALGRPQTPNEVIRDDK